MEDKKFSKCLDVLSIDLLSQISGGGNNSDKTPPPAPSTDKPTMKIAGGGNSDVAYGTVYIETPVTPNTSVGVGVGGNTTQGITNGRITVTYCF